MLKLPLLVIFFLLQIFQTFAISEQNREHSKVNEWEAIIKKNIYSDIQTSKTYIDSLHQWAVTKNDTSLLSKTYNFQAIQSFIKKDYASALKNYRISLEMARNIGDTKREAIALANIGLTFKVMHNDDSAIVYNIDALAIAKENSYNDLTAKYLTDLNYLLIKHYDFTQAAQNLYEAIEIGFKNNDQMILTYAYSGMAHLYHALNKPAETIKNFKLALYHDSLTEDINTDYIIYMNLGEIYWHNYNNRDSADYYNQKALETAPSSEKEAIYHATLLNIGNIHFDTEKYEIALEHYNKVLDHPYAEIFPDRKAIAMVNKGFLKFKLMQFDESRKYLLQGLKISDSLNIFNPMHKALYNLYILDSTLGNYKSALDYYQQYHQLTNKQKKEEALENLAELSINRELENLKEKNELLQTAYELKQDQILQQRNFQYLLLLILFGSVLFTIIQIRNQSKIKKLNKKLQTQNIQITASNEALQNSNNLLAEQQYKLEQLNRTKDKFVSVIGHDLKSPFNSLLGILGLLNDDWNSFNEKEKQNLIEALLNSTQNTYQLLEDLLVWGKSQQGLIKKYEETFMASEIINTMKNLMQQNANVKSITLETNCQYDFQITTDKRLLSQIVQNFVSNAIKYTNRNGKVSIEAKKIDKDMIFTVIDSGIGIPEEILPKIFDLDVDFGRPGTESEKSTGMGLILCKEFANTIGAKLEATSEEGIGSKFSIALEA